MPNHVTSVLYVHAPSKEWEHTKQLYALVKGLLEESSEDNFNLFYHPDGIMYETLTMENLHPCPMELLNRQPLPKSLLFSEEITHEERKVRAELKKEYGFDNWYDWRIENWGTKWDMYEFHGIHSDYKTGEFEIQFQTAWAAPHDFLNFVSKLYPDLNFHLQWADEDTGANAGMYVLHNGFILSGGAYEDGSKEAYEMAFELTGSEYFYKFNKDTDTYEWDESKEDEAY